MKQNRRETVSSMNSASNRPSPNKHPGVNVPLARNVLKRELFFLPAGSDAEEGNFPGYGGMEVCTSHYNLQRQGFPFIIFEIFEQGSAEISLNNKRYEIGSGSFFCYGPEHSFTISASKSDPPVKYFIALVPENLKNLPGISRPLNQLRGNSGFCIDFHDIDFLFRLLAKESRKRMNPELCLNLLAALFRKTTESLPHLKMSPTGSMILDSFDKVKQAIAENCQKLHNLSDIANLTGYSNAYLCQIFKKNGESSPYKFLINQKIQIAAALLETTPWKVNAIAQQVGYEDPFQFSRIFRRIMGISPTGFREMIQ